MLILIVLFFIVLLNSYLFFHTLLGLEFVIGDSLYNIDQIQ